MKVPAGLAMVPILASLAHAESLGDAAKRERHRREKNKVTEAKVIGEAELAAGRGNKAKGTFSAPTGSASGAANANVARPSSPSTKDGSGEQSEVDARRAFARERLEVTYQEIAEKAGSLIQAANQYTQCLGSTFVPNRSCERLLVQIQMLVVSVGVGIEFAEETARQWWLTPGYVRDARKRHGLDDPIWDELVRVVRQHRR